MADRLLEGAGATDSNGSTDYDRTNYYDTVPSNQLELALWVHADRMGYLLDVLDQKALTNQQDVVRNERRESVENRALRHRRGSAEPRAVPEGPPVLRLGDRLARRHPEREAGRRARVLHPLLRPEQRQHRDRRRHRQGEDARAGGEILRQLQARPGGGAPEGRHAADHGRAPRWWCRRPRRTAARVHGLADAARLPAGRRRAGGTPRSSPAARPAGCTNRWCTNARSRRTSTPRRTRTR
jgi:hypothetical protein